MKEPWTGDPAEEGRMRIGDTGERLVIQWISTGWTTHELQLPVFYREALGRLLAMEKFRNLIETNIEAGITLYTDHKPALFENSCPLDDFLAHPQGTCASSRARRSLCIHPMLRDKLFAARPN